MVHSTISHGVLKERYQAFAKEAEELIVADKIPIVKAIVGANLASLLEWSVDFRARNAHRQMTVDEAKKLSGLATELNSLIRLEEGKSTVNMGIVNQVEKEVTVILEELKEVDPFVSYDRQDEGSEEAA